MCVWVQSEGVGGDGDLINIRIMMILMTMILMTMIMMILLTMIMYLGDDTVTIHGGAKHLAASTHHQCTEHFRSNFRRKDFFKC